MTATGAALAPLVDALLAERLDELDVEQLQTAITTVTPLVARLHGWLSAAAGQLDQLTGGTVPGADGRARTAAGRLEHLTGGSLPNPVGGRPRTVAGWLADVQHTTAGAAVTSAAWPSPCSPPPSPGRAGSWC